MQCTGYDSKLQSSDASNLDEKEKEEEDEELKFLPVSRISGVSLL